jgi:glutaredoxin
MSLIIYTKTGCPWCAEALQFLDKNSVAYEEREVRSNTVFFEELKTKSGQEKTPTLDLDGTILADTDAEAIEIFLKENGVLS